MAYKNIGLDKDRKIEELARERQRERGRGCEVTADIKTVERT